MRTNRRQDVADVDIIADRNRVMQFMRRSVAVLLAGLSIIPYSASAQDVIMRKSIHGHHGMTTPPITPPAPVDRGTWTTSQPIALAASCSAQAPAKREVWCAGKGGAVLGDEACSTAGARPDAMTTIADYSGCGYEWHVTGQGAWSSTCSDSATRSVSTACIRQDGESAPDGSCDASQRPPAVETVANLSGCRYEASGWTVGQTESLCSSNTSRVDKATTCMRTDEAGVGSTVPMKQCGDAGLAVSRRVESLQNYEGCNVDWVETSSNVNSMPTCTAEFVVVRTVECQRTGAGITPTTLPDASCKKTKPATTQTITNYDGCTVNVASASVMTYGNSENNEYPSRSFTATKGTTYTVTVEVSVTNSGYGRVYINDSQVIFAADLARKKYTATWKSPVTGSVPLRLNAWNVYSGSSTATFWKLLISPS